ncbi:ribonuclease H [Senna tora]|uniref:Ribonuclease H n=1 Tax=Senna tora TaxID=362788 RepID=A0A835C8E4_9FABA|nr:ribonuclease H [Senna tora]
MIETINNLGLVDLQTSGNWFTWTNGRQGEDLVWERLGKSLANTNWLQHFPDSWVQVLPVIGSLSSQIQDKIRNVSKDLSLWHKENFGDLSNQIKEAHTQVEKFQKNIHDHIRNNEELVTRKRLEFLLNCEEIKWAQRAKQLWLLKGDRNTNNDAADETARRQFISNSGTPKLNQGHIQHLSKPFTRLEIENALFQTHAGKAPGPDGMTPMFFQHCLDTVQEDVTRMVGSFLSRGFLLRSMNQTHIALIPKMDSPSGFKDYRPISLYNTTYKLIAKVLTNRLQEVMPNLISPFQNAFVKGRLIQDNILIASETLHYIRRCKKSKGGWAALKMLMQCVTTTSMRVKINGEMTEWFLPRVGLRQGNPLSPYLYVLCANVFSNHLIIAQNDRSIQGIKIARGAPSINHLMYADHILRFFRADKSTCDMVHKLLNQFGELAGLWMNNHKSKVKFSPNITEEGAQVLTRILNFRRVNHLGRYLGGYIDRYNTAKRNASLILDNLQQRLTGWKSRMLSQAARTTLIKAIVSAIPIYHMQHTWLSKSEAAKCDGVMRKFFWSQWDESKTPIMISWKRLCKGRSEGGGFWDEAKVAQVYTSYKKALILDTVISHTNVEDKMAWNITDNGEFSVKKVYEIITNNTHTHGSPSFKWNRFWQLPLPQRVLLFWWKNLNKGLPLKMNLSRKGFQISSDCPWILDLPKVSKLSKTSSPQHKEIVMLLLSICWSFYTQRNQLLFQQGKADVAGCLNRAYKIVDEIVGIDIIQRQDYFFNLEVPMKQRGDGSRTTEHNAGGIVLTCSWKKYSSIRKKVFDIFQQVEVNQKLLCSMVTEDDQDDCLALLRSVRLFLEDYGRDQMGPITFNIPSKNIITHLNHIPIAHISIVTTTSSPKVFLLTGLLGGIL